MKLLNTQFSLAVLMLLSAPVAGAQNALMSEDEALKNFKEAAKLYRQDAGSMEEPLLDDDETSSETTSDESDLMEPMEDEGISTIDQNEIDAYDYKLEDEYAPVEDIVVNIDLENKTLEEVVTHIIDQAADQAGEWKVKWRVSPQNNYILNERVNLIAETNLSEFMSYLVDRVNNMTGIQLFVTVFDKSRIIVISDTYY